MWKLRKGAGVYSALPLHRLALSRHLHLLQLALICTSAQTAHTFQGIMSDGKKPKLREEVHKILEENLERDPPISKKEVWRKGCGFV